MDAAVFEQVYGAFQDFHAYFAPLFGRREARDHSRHYLQALLVQSGERRNAENLSETVPASARVMQRFLAESPWDDDTVIGRLQADIPQIEPPFLDIAPAGMLPTIISHSKGVKCVLIRSNSSFHGPTTVLPSVKSPNRWSTTKSLPWEALLPCTTR